MSDQKKYELIEKLVNTEDELLLSQISAILEGSSLEFWSELNPELKASINRGLDQSQRGEGMVHEEAMKEFRSRIKK